MSGFLQSRWRVTPELKNIERVKAEQTESFTRVLAEFGVWEEFYGSQKWQLSHSACKSQHFSQCRDDCRSMISQRVQNSHPSLLYRQLQPIIAPKRGPPVQPVNLTPDDLNSYFTSIGTETRDRVAAEFNRSGREPLNVRLPRVNTGALNIVPVTLDHLQRILASLPQQIFMSGRRYSVKSVETDLRRYRPLPTQDREQKYCDRNRSLCLEKSCSHTYL